MKQTTFTVTRRTRSQNPHWTHYPAGPDSKILSNTQRVVRAVKKLRMIPDDGREHFVALMLNARNLLLAWHVVSTGSLTGTTVSPREVFGAAMRVIGTAAIVCVHNHPSGDPEPSTHDRVLTLRLIRAGDLLDIPMHDHIVIGSGTEEWASIMYPKKSKKSKKSKKRKERR